MSGRGAIGSALALGARGCEFESRRPDQFYFLYFISFRGNNMDKKIFLIILFSTFQIFAEKKFFYPPYHETKASLLRKQNSKPTAYLQSQTANFKESVDRISNVLDSLHRIKNQKTTVMDSDKKSNLYSRFDTASSSAGTDYSTQDLSSSTPCEENISATHPVVNPAVLRNFYPFAQYNQA